MKRKLRHDILAWRERIDKETRQQKSRLIKDKLLALNLFQSSSTIMFFLSFKSEVDTFPIICRALKMGKRVVVPKTVPAEKKMIPSLLSDLKADLEPGLKGIMEPKMSLLRPVAAQEIDLVLVPGVAFDRAGNRLGYGGGYYDRFFPLLRQNTPLVALAFEGQLVNEVPTGPYDKKVDLLITEERIYYFNSSC